MIRTSILAFTLIATVTLPGPAGAQSALERSRRDDVAIVPDNDPAMQRAFARASATLDQFLTLAASPRPGTEGFAVKIAVRDGSTTEFFWVTPFRRSGNGFTGRLNNTPRLVSNVRLGQTLRFSRSEIVDWMYTEGTRMRGNYTACALLERETPAQRAAFQQHYGLACD